MFTDCIIRIDSNDGQAMEYLMLPRETNIQNLHVDNSSTPVTVWVKNTFTGAAIDKSTLRADAGFGTDAHRVMQYSIHRSSRGLYNQLARLPENIQLYAAVLILRCKEPVVGEFEICRIQRKVRNYDLG